MLGSAFRVTAIAVTALLPAFDHAANTQPLAPETAGALANNEVSTRYACGSHGGVKTQAGASTARINAAAIAAISKRDIEPRASAILHAHEVAQGTFAQFHSRGAPDGLQCRLSNVTLRAATGVLGESALSPTAIRHAAVWGCRSPQSLTATMSQALRTDSYERDL